MAYSAALARARAGIERRDWREALRSFQDVAASVALGADDLELPAEAHALTLRFPRQTRAPPV